MFYLIAIPLAFVPSLLWLLFYLRKDVHPEPNRAVMRVFLWGMGMTFLAALFLYAGACIWREVSDLTINLKNLLPSFLSVSLAVIFINAFWEEALKFFVVKKKALNTPEFDEPVDAMEYMIIAALGFAAVENVLICFSYDISQDFYKILQVLFTRFIGATFIHALSSAIVGYFLARALFWKKNRKRYPLRAGLVFWGLLIATGLHGAFNFLIIKVFESESIKTQQNYLYLIAAVLIISSLIVIRGLRKLNYQSLKK